MSKLFYDHLIVFEEIEAKLSSYNFSSPDEKEEVHQMIEESVHYRVMACILDHLPREHHNQFLELFHRSPHHPGLLTFLKDRVENIEEIIKKEVKDLEKVLLKDIESAKIKEI
jgi:hypothetical protein